MEEFRPQQPSSTCFMMEATSATGTVGATSFWNNMPTQQQQQPSPMPTNTAWPPAIVTRNNSISGAGNGTHNGYPNSFTGMGGVETCSSRSSSGSDIASNRSFDSCAGGGSVVYVGGLHPSMTKESVEKLLSPYGDIQSLQLVMYSPPEVFDVAGAASLMNDTSYNCYGYCHYRDPKSAVAAILSLDGRMLLGKQLQVQQQHYNTTRRQQHQGQPAVDNNATGGDGMISYDYETMSYQQGDYDNGRNNKRCLDVGNTNNDSTTAVMDMGDEDGVDDDNMGYDSRITAIRRKLVHETPAGAWW